MRTLKHSTILKKARDLIAKGGWCQHTSKSGTRYCLTGAIREFYFASDLKELRRYFTPMLGPLLPFGLVGYNDTKGRTKEQVLAAFDAAIKEAKKAGQ